MTSTNIYLKRKTILFAVQGPSQLLNCLVTCFANNTCKLDITLLLFDFCTTSVQSHILLKSTLHIAKAAGISAIFYLDDDISRNLMKKSYRSKLKFIRNRLGTNFSEVYLIRGRIGMISPMILNAYPDAFRICVGDSFGLVGGKDEEFFSYYSLLRFFRDSFTQLRSFGPFYYLGFNCLEAPLPIDLGGPIDNRQTLAVNIPLKVADKASCLETINCLHGQLRDIIDFESYLFSLSHSRHITIFLLPDIVSTGKTSFDDALSLYFDTIKAYVQNGTLLVVKLHPRTGESISTELSKKLHEFEIIFMNEHINPTYPIELFVELCNKASFVIFNSTSAISISYFYESTVYLALSPEIIKQYYFSFAQQPEIYNLIIISACLSRLKDWNQNDFLFKSID